MAEPDVTARTDFEPSPEKQTLLALRDSFASAKENPLLPPKASDSPQIRAARRVALLDQSLFPDSSHRRYLQQILSRAALVPEAGGYTSGAEGAAALDYLLGQMEPPASRGELNRELLRIVASAREGAGGAYLLSAPSGYGKSVLWRTVSFAYRRPGEVWCYYKSPQSGVSPYGVVARVLDCLLRELAERTGRQPRKLLSELVPQLPGREAIEELLRSLILPSGVSSDPVLNRRVDYSSGFAGTLRSIADREPIAPTILVIDDLQWCDDQSVSIFRHLAANPGRLGMILIGRPEGATLMEGVDPLGRGRLPRLEPWETEALLTFLFATEPEAPSESSLLSWLTEYANGVPLELVHGFRSALQTLRLARPLVVDGGGSLTHERLRKLSPQTRRFLEDIAFLLPPVQESVVRRLPLPEGFRIERVLEEAEAEDLLEWDRPAGELRFRHDAIESALRRGVSVTRERFVEVSRILKEQLAGGDYRARYVLARLLSTEFSGPDQRRIAEGIGVVFSSSEVARLLSESAERALGFVAADEALQFARRALELGGGALSEAETLKLHILSHRGAFLLDNVTLMSHHFRRITALGSSVDSNRARTEWISRSYSKLWIRGALRIGWRILHELGAVDESDARIVGARRREIAAAESFLRRRRSESLRRRLESLPVCEREESRLITRVAATLLIPLLTLDPERIPVMAWLIFREALRWGASEYTGFGFVYWSVYRSQRDFRGRRRAIPAFSAERFVRRDDVPPAARAATESYAAIFGTHWVIDHRSIADRYLQLYRAAASTGSYEWAGHALHLHAQGLFFRGEPLQEVYDVLDDHRHRLSEFGLNRIAKALSKFQQAAETLTGATGDPLTLGGSLFREDELRRELIEKEDHLGMSGFYLLKGLLAAYADRPEIACEHFSRFGSTTEIHGAMNTVPIFRFFHGFSAWTVGAVEIGRESLRLTRRFGTKGYGKHRALALAAAEANFYKHVRKADRLFTAARKEALTDGFPNEAALISERHGRLLLEWSSRRTDAFDGRRRRGLELLHISRSLYQSWGAASAAERVSAILAAAQPTVLGGTGTGGDKTVGLTYRAGAGGITPGAGGITPGAGGITPGAGGITPGAGGITPGAGGITPGAGGITPGAVGETSLEAQLDETSRDLANTRKNAMLLFATVSDALLLLNQEGEVLFHNPAATLYLREGEGIKIRGDLEQQVRALLDSAFGTMESREEEIEIAEGTVLVTVSPAPREAGGGVAATVMRDVSETRERERQLIVADRMSSLGLLASTVAHEVGNPNHILQLNAQTLQMWLAKLEQEADWLSAAREAVENILYGAQRIGEVVEQVKAYGRDGREEEWEIVDPREISRRVVRFSQMLVSGKTGDFQYEESDELPKIRASRGLLEQALINLITNACEAIPDRRAKIRLLVDRDGDWVRFAVADQGPGFRPELRGQPAAPFVTTRKNSGGTGLGLSIVRSILKRHRGTLTFRNDAEYSTIAEVRIPSTLERINKRVGEPPYQNADGSLPDPE